MLSMVIVYQNHDCILKFPPSTYIWQSFCHCIHHLILLISVAVIVVSLLLSSLMLSCWIYWSLCPLLVLVTIVDINHIRKRYSLPSCFSSSSSLYLPEIRSCSTTIAKIVIFASPSTIGAHTACLQDSAGQDFQRKAETLAMIVLGLSQH